MPVGIENLATGFLQGLNAKKQQERQDVIDQREAERFDMRVAAAIPKPNPTTMEKETRLTPMP